MESSLDITALSHGELVAFVYRLRQQVEERDQEIARLKQQLLEEQSHAARDVVETAGKKEMIPSEEVQQPGSQEELLSQLQEIYPGRE